MTFDIAMFFPAGLPEQKISLFKVVSDNVILMWIKVR